jgi:hypothetical protein
MNIEKKRRIKKYAFIDWSDYQGRMSWYKAMEKSKLTGMRLPTMEELKLAFRTKEIKNWKEKGKCYWSSDSNDDSIRYAYAIYLSSGVSYHYDKTMELDVRFIRDKDSSSKNSI